MNRITELNRLLGDLGQRYNISNLHLGGHNAVALTLRDKIELMLEYVPSSDKLFIYTVVCSLPDDEEEAATMCRRLLEMNCMEQDTFGGILSLDGRRDTVLYQVGLAAAGLTLPRLEQVMQDLLARRGQVIESVKGASPAPRVKQRSTLARLIK